METFEKASGVSLDGESLRELVALCLADVLS